MPSPNDHPIEESCGNNRYILLLYISIKGTKNVIVIIYKNV